MSKKKITKITSKSKNNPNAKKSSPIKADVRKPTKTKKTSRKREKTDKLTHPERNILEIAGSFHLSVASIRMFIIKLGTIADSQDEKIMEDFFSKLKQISTPCEFDTNEGGQKEKNSNAKKSEAYKINTEDFSNLGDELRNLAKNAPFQGTLLRMGALTALISNMESLISDLIQYFYSNYPNALNSESNRIKLSELKECGSIEEAERLIIINQIDSIITTVRLKQGQLL